MPQPMYMKQRMTVEHYQTEIWSKKQMHLSNPSEDFGNLLINQL